MVEYSIKCTEIFPPVLNKNLRNVVDYESRNRIARGSITSIWNLCSTFEDVLFQRNSYLCFFFDYYKRLRHILLESSLWSFGHGVLLGNFITDTRPG